MLRALIADDEALSRRLIREYLHAHPDIHVAAECDNGLDAARLIAAETPELVFLDIQMPRLNGLEVLEASGRRHGVIFTTAHDQHALRAFDLAAVDYLLKPYSQARFDEAVQRARARQAPAALDNLLRQHGLPLQRIVLRERDQLHVIALERVEQIEAQDDYIAIHADGHCYLKLQRLSDIETQLDAHTFLRVHRSHIVNLLHVATIERQGKDSQSLRLKSGRQVPVSRSGLERLRAVL